ncbi:hypothetical protein BDV93DRAFT_611553 [Ceratobasidium sp. AG-I]|nr:hypothetical protein BDV93DRAFT_611553 [Ceratobasidium sp. AG-I]
MSVSRFRFEYFITRAYPWRFTTWSIVIGSTFMFVGLLYFNLATAGLTIVPYLSPTFEAQSHRSWIDRINIERNLSIADSCSPATLVSGGVYKTQNGAFSYTIQSLQDQETGELVPSIAYSGGVLEDCSILPMTVFINYLSFDAEFEVTLHCKLEGNIRLIASTSVLVTLRPSSNSSIFQQIFYVALTGRFDSTVSKIALLLRSFGRDVLNQFIPTTPGMLGGLPVTTVSSEFYLNSNFTIGYFTTVWTTNGFVHQNGPALDDAFNTTTMYAFNNFVRVFWSAVLFDVGENAAPNMLTDAGLMSQAIQQDFQANNESGPGYVLTHLSEFHLPLNQTEPVQFNARYLCQRMYWKAPAKLAVDVIVATSSLFMVHWGILQFVLRYFAKRSSPKGNFCAGCAGLLQDGSDTFETKQRRSVDTASGYELLSSPTQSMHHFEKDSHT